MIIKYDIINKNLEKLNLAIKAFPEVLGQYKKANDSNNDAKIFELNSIATKLGLSEYTKFIRWIKNAELNNQKIVYENTISFDILRIQMEEKGIDEKFKSSIPKTKRGFLGFIKNEFDKFNGGSYGRGRYKRYYSSLNYQNSECCIMNYIIQNEIDWKYSFGEFYINELPNFEYKAIEELEITNDITKSIIRKINGIKYDFRKLNYNILKSEIESKIKEKILSVEKDEQIRCLEEAYGVTLNKIYFVKSYRISTNGSLEVSIINDHNRDRVYNYRIFENVSKLRDNKIDNLLAIFQ